MERISGKTSGYNKNLIGTSSDNEIEKKKPDDKPPLENVLEEEQQLSVETSSLAMHYPSAVIKRNLFLVDEVTAKLLRYFPMKNNFSLVNRSMYILNKEISFFSLLRQLPEVNQQIKKGNLLIDVAEAMQLRNESELARYLARNLNSENQEELIPHALLMLQYLANEGCPTAQCELGALFYQGGGGIKNYYKALEWFYKAQQKSGDACCLIGLMFMKGEGVPQSFEQAKDWLNKAIALNPSNEHAYYHIGLMLSGFVPVRDDDGFPGFRSAPEDYEEGFRHLQKAADLGSIPAMIRLVDAVTSRVFMRGAELELAMEYFEKAINGGSPVAFTKLAEFSRRVWENHGYTNGIEGFLLGHLYINGWHVQKDVVTGIGFLKAAVEEGHVKALLKLSDWYIQSQILKSDHSSGVDLLSIKQFVIKHLEKAAHNRSSPEALYTLGTLYELDSSVDSQKKANSYFEQAIVRDKHKKALEKVGADMLKRAAEDIVRGEYLKAYASYAPLAEAGDDEAKQKIAFMFMGKMITAKDKKLFVSCLEYVANRGSADAAFELGDWHMSVPLIKNSGEASKWYVKAYYRGRVDAAFQLGTLYLSNSIFSSQSELLEAKKWFGFAVNNKIKGAHDKLAEVNTKLKSRSIF